MRAVIKVSPLREGAPYQHQDAISPMKESPPSLLFCLDGDEVMDDASSVAPVDVPSDVMEQLHWLLHPNGEADARLKLHVQIARECALGHQLDTETLGLVLQRAGYTAKLHCPPTPKLGLRHSFLTVCLPDGGDSGSSTFVVDPHFRDSFLVAHPTPRYAALLEALPQEVVTTQACLRRAVTILAGELARSFTEQGSPVPPWRTQSALMSKWQLQHSPAGCGEPLPLGGAAQSAAAKWAADAAEGGTAAFGRVS